MHKATVLLVEDNPRIQLANQDMLSILGYNAVTASSIREAREKIEECPPDIVVLDIMLPDGSGLDFLVELRRHLSVPILMLTALGTSEDMVTGLSAGADDYLSKPYDYNVLAARIEALLRRTARLPQSLTKGTLTFNILAGQVFINGDDALLTQKEFSCLLLLAENEDRVLSSAYIYERIWRMPMANDNQAVRTTIARLRSKLIGSGYTIAAHRKEGYCFFKI
ncbi:response regulator transcription factor [Bacillota bacterium]